MRLFSVLFALSVTASTVLIAAALNNSSASRNAPRKVTAASFRPVKEPPKIRKREIKRKPKLKNIKQAPRVSPNLFIAVDIPLEMPQVEQLHTELLGEEIKILPPAPHASNPPPAYPRSARQDGIQGRVVASVLIDEYGYVIKTGIKFSDPPGVFDHEVLVALKSWRFSPATLQGAPVEQWVEIPFNFVL